MDVITDSLMIQSFSNIQFFEVLVNEFHNLFFENLKLHILHKKRLLPLIQMVGAFSSVPLAYSLLHPDDQKVNFNLQVEPSLRFFYTIALSSFPQILTPGSKLSDYSSPTITFFCPGLVENVALSKQWVQIFLE